MAAGDRRSWAAGCQLDVHGGLGVCKWTVRERRRRPGARVQELGSRAGLSPTARGRSPGVRSESLRSGAARGRPPTPPCAPACSCQPGDPGGRREGDPESRAPLRPLRNWRSFRTRGRGPPRAVIAARGSGTSSASALLGFSGSEPDLLSLGSLSRIVSRGAAVSVLCFLTCLVLNLHFPESPTSLRKDGTPPARPVGIWDLFRDPSRSLKVGGREDSSARVG